MKSYNVWNINHLARAVEKTQQLQWARYRHFLHDRYENPW